MNYATLYANQGFFVLRGVLAAEEVMRLRNVVYDYMERGGRLVSTHAFGNHGGWFAGGVHLEHALRDAVSLIDGKARLHAALESVLGSGRVARNNDDDQRMNKRTNPSVPRSYRMLSRNEIYIDRYGTWHSDTVIGAYSRYTPPSLTPCRRAFGCLWDPLPGGGPIREREYGVATVATYLEPHENDTQALHVKPRTHVSDVAQRNGVKRRSGAHDADGMVLHPRLGDIIVFDTRLVHRGQDEAYANLRKDRTFRAADRHRGLLALTYGRHNAFSESHDRAFAMRNQLVSNKSLCGGQWMSKCALSAMERDLKENPLLG